jgi:hypothetical protein
MPPIFGFLLYLAATAAVVVVARKRGQKAWLYGVACIVCAPLLVMLIGSSGGSGNAAGFGAFLVPIVALFVALSSSTSEQTAVKAGEHGDFKKCPFCAESVRREAIKCKHCGSELGSGNSAA